MSYIISLHLKIKIKTHPYINIGDLTSLMSNE